MNSTALRTIAISLALAGSLGACKGASAPDADSAPAAPMAAEPAAAAPMAQTPAPAAEAGPEAAPMPIPETADGIWLAIDQHSGELKSTIASGDLKSIHHHALAIRDLVAALPERSPTLSAEDTSKLQGEIKFVATLADRLDTAGDANDQAGAQANFDKLTTVLTGITRTK